MMNQFLCHLGVILTTRRASLEEINHHARQLMVSLSIEHDDEKSSGSSWFALASYVIRRPSVIALFIPSKAACLVH
jgi:hypothetical protein